MICYVDTHVAVWLAEANLAKISRKALSLVEMADLRISPMAVVELQYLYEIRRILVSPQHILVKLSAEIGLTLCDHPFPIIAGRVGAPAPREVSRDARLLGAHR